jgi:hypothetical protein
MCFDEECWTVPNLTEGLQTSTYARLTPGGLLAVGHADHSNHRFRMCRAPPGSNVAMFCLVDLRVPALRESQPTGLLVDSSIAREELGAASTGSSRRARAIASGARQPRLESATRGDSGCTCRSLGTCRARSFVKAPKTETSGLDQRLFRAHAGNVGVGSAESTGLPQSIGP